MPSSTGDEFYDQRVAAAAAVPPERRSQDVAVFLEAVELGNAAAALLPLPLNAAPRRTPQTDEETVLVMAAAAKAAEPLQLQAAGDAEAAAVLAYLAISYACLPGQPRPLNHPRFAGEGQARVEAVLGGAAAIALSSQAEWDSDRPGRSAQQRAEELQRMRSRGVDVRPLPNGGMALVQNCVEEQLLPGLGRRVPPRELHTAVRALLLASAYSITRRTADSARLLLKLAPVFDNPAALAQLGEQLAAAQARRGDAPPRLPSAQQLLQLWLRMIGRTGNSVSEAEGWRGVQEWAAAAVSRVAQLDSANPRAWHELVRNRGSALNDLEALGVITPRYLQQYKKVTAALWRSLETARSANNVYHTAFAAYTLALDAARLEQKGCPPTKAAALLREAEAAWAAAKDLLPQEWASELRRERAAALAFQAVVQAHERESPQTWKRAIFDRLSGSVMRRFDLAESRRVERASTTCDACGETALAMQHCAGCGQARYCSRECQRAHWKQHKAACKAAQAARAGGSATPREP